MHPIDPSFLNLLNQVFEIEKKASKLEEPNSIERNVRRIKSLFEEGLPVTVGHAAVKLSLVYHDPAGESYDETRTDCEASIAGDSAENLRIIEVIKPVIRVQGEGIISRIVQKAVVVVASAPESDDAV